MRSPAVQRDFSEFLASLNAARVKYLVVGAYALAVHGAPRNTLDLDVFVQPTRANGARAFPYSLRARATRTPTQ